MHKSETPYLSFFLKRVRHVYNEENFHGAVFFNRNLKLKTLTISLAFQRHRFGFRIEPKGPRKSMKMLFHHAKEVFCMWFQQTEYQFGEKEFNLRENIENLGEFWIFVPFCTGNSCIKQIPAKNQPKFWKKYVWVKRFSSSRYRSSSYVSTMLK